MALNITTSIVDFLKSKGKGSSFGERGNLYKQSPTLTQRLGTYTGTGDQNRALLNYAQKQFEQPAATTQASTLQTQPSPNTQVPQSLVDRFQNVQQQAGQLGKRVLTEGITGAQGQQLAPPIDQVQTDADVQPVQRAAFDVFQTAQGAQQAPGAPKVPEQLPQAGQPEGDPHIGPAPGSTASPIEGKDIAKTVALQDTDLSGLIKQFSSGELKDVDLEISSEAKRLAMAGEEDRAQKALSQLQQGLARQGMTFSGLRTKAEQDLAAQSLANKSGISLNFAKSIIGAAQQEQSRRETANQQAQAASANALKAMGYVTDPITGSLTKTLERERFEGQEEGAPKTFGTASGGYFQWNAETGEYEQIVAPQPGGQKPTSRERFETEAGPLFEQIRTGLMTVKNQFGGKLPVSVYMQERNNFLLQFPTRSNEFDNTFAPLLSPTDRKTLGVGKTPTISVTEQIFGSGGGFFDDILGEE